MLSQIKTYTYPNGEIQRVQCVKLDRWEELHFAALSYEDPAFEGFCNIYRRYLLPTCPWIFGQMVMFRLPEDVEVPLVYESSKYGAVADRLTAAAMLLEKGVKIRFGKPRFSDENAKKLYLALEKQGCLQIVSGKLPTTQVIAVGSLPGYLTHTQEARLKINAHFFIMDPIDCATVFDHVGMPIGLSVKDGVVSNPPLYGREALLVKKDGSVTVKPLDLTDLTLEIGGVAVDGTVYARPKAMRTPNDKRKKLVIVGDRVVAVKQQGSACVPASGVVVAVADCTAKPGDRVVYRGLEDVTFGVQIGNSILRNGEKTKEFLSKFYNVRRLEPVPYPPSLYPMDFENARAARTAIGADGDGKPMLLWAEGKGKLRYQAGEDSCGASLPEMAEICADLGMVNAVNMDGGGSAQILLHGRRQLMICDRNPDNTEAERAIPFALIVK